MLTIIQFTTNKTLGGGVMTRMIDLEKMEAQWLSTIKKRKKTIQQCDIAIQEQQTKKQEANNEIEKYNRFIHTAREMSGRNTADLKEKIEIPTQTLAPSNESIKGLKMPQAIRNILSGESQKNFTATEIANLLREKGFESDSPNFRNIVFNTLHRITGKYITVNRRGFENKYKIIEEDENESLLKMKAY